jgi:hypothetical protein
MVPLCIRDDEVRMILPESCRDQFRDGQNVNGYGVLHGNVLYMVRDSFIAYADENLGEKVDFSLHEVTAQVVTPEGAEGIRLMATEHR